MLWVDYSSHLQKSWQSSAFCFLMYSAIWSLVGRDGRVDSELRHRLIKGLVYCSGSLHAGVTVLCLLTELFI